tara:strand:- start:305 stop:556 length:252 start_codon:yes stop_codon:yes gene_type:complete
MNINENKEIEEGFQTAEESLIHYELDNGRDVLICQLSDVYILAEEDGINPFHACVEYVRKEFNLTVSQSTRVTFYSLKKLEII